MLLMRVLILSCNTGEGHNSCGRALQRAFQARGIPCDMEDAFAFFSVKGSRFISSGFVGVYRHVPKLFSWGYQFTEEHPSVFREDSPAYRMLTVGADNVMEFITGGEYDTVLCTHVFSALILTEGLRRKPMPLRTAFVATDYTCSPSCADSRLDTYFIPAESLKAEFAACGIPEEKLVAAGIPLRPEFAGRRDKSAAREALALPADCRHLLVMCGSMGCGPIREMVDEVASRLTDNCRVSVVCGTNRKLEEELNEAYSGREQIRIYGFVNHISQLMDSADLYLTKPGGISVTEASRKTLPMFFVNAVAGCESHNMRFFLERGGAATAERPAEIAEACLDLLADEARLAGMSRALECFAEQRPEEAVLSWAMEAAAGV